MKTFCGCNRRAREISVLSNIGDPCGFEVPPYASGQTNAWREFEFSGHGFELWKLSDLGLPDLETTQHAAIRHWHPETAYIPSEAFTNCLENSRGCVSESRRF